MRKSLILAVPLVAAATFAGSALAQQGTVTGAGTGAVTGAIVGGPVGAAVGGVVGAIAGTAIAPPPPRVVTYVQAHPQTSVVYDGRIAVGAALPEAVVLYPVPDDPTYYYTVVNNQRVIVDPRTRIVVQIAG